MKTCLMCKEPFSGKRTDSIFCSSSCKAKHWELKKQGKLNGLEGIKLIPVIPQSAGNNQIKEAENLEPLQNVVGDIKINNHKNQAEMNGKEIPLPAQYINKYVKEDNFYFLLYQGKLVQCRKDISTYENEIKRLTGLVESEKKRNGSGLCLATAGTGLWLGFDLSAPKFKPEEITIRDKNGKRIPYNKRKIPAVKNENSGDRLFSAILGGLLGAGVGGLINSLTSDSREQSKITNIKNYEKQITQWQSYIPILKQQEKQILSEQSKYPPFELKEVKIVNPAYTVALKQIEAQKLITQQNLEGLNKDNKQNIPPDIKIQTEEFENGKIVSMQQIANIKHPLLNFQGKWRAFFGLPQTNFFCVIHGMSGEGKTNFSMQFAKYLAETFGKVLFVSGEEGFAPTFQQKIKLLGADSVINLYAGDIRTGKELLNEVPNNKFHFIVIDSLNNMGIDPDLMRQIRNKFKHSAIIAICQSTKDGKVRGSYEMIHDSDIAVKVTNGIAVTTKNRFKEKNMEFDVFEAMRKKELPSSFMLSRKKDNDDPGMDISLRNTI
ncbi:MAG: hypothetical protein ACT4ON_10360 [Bacteroidota bacterium]